MAWALVLTGLIFSTLAGQTADPTPADWTFQSDQAFASLGVNVASAGDVNADGFGDVVVSATTYDGTHLSGGRVYLFLGSPSGLPAVPDWSAIGGHFYQQLRAYETAGDINGDGFDDVLLSDGRLFFGSPSGLTEAHQQTAAYRSFTSGDVDGDGHGDLVVGTADLYLGTPQGLSADPARHFEPKGRMYAPVLSDLTGDEYADLVMGDYVWDPYTPTLPGITTLQLFRGGPSGMTGRGRAPKPEWLRQVPILGAAGDVNGDGFNDLVLGLQRILTATSIHELEPVHLLGGSRSGPRLAAGPFYRTGLAAPLHAVDGAGDVDGDGYDDVLVVDEESGRRRLLVFAGGPDGPTGPPTVLLGLWQVPGNENEIFAASATGAGDVNGDGCDDLLVGAPGFSDGEYAEGRVLLFLGNPGFFASAGGAWSVSADPDRIGPFR